MPKDPTAFRLSARHRVRLASGSLSILQSRPVTRIGFSADVGQWTNADFRDGGVSSTVCTPLMGSLYAFIGIVAEGLAPRTEVVQERFSSDPNVFWPPLLESRCGQGLLCGSPGFVEREFDQDLSVEINYEDDGHVTPVTPCESCERSPRCWPSADICARQQRAAEALLMQALNRARKATIRTARPKWSSED